MQSTQQTTRRHLSIAELEKELRTQKRQLARLVAKRDEAKERLASYQALINQLQNGGNIPASAPETTAAAVAKPEKNQKSLVKTLMSILEKAGSPMTVGELTTAVQNKGYQTKSKNFRLIVNQTLLTRPEFRKTKRATFTLGKAKENKKVKASRKARKGKNTTKK